uniref:CLIP domain-containing serine protease n=1 Tax=Megaselia scalaris TaxID=36166 RepID=T1GVM4_MEGSC
MFLQNSQCENGFGRMPYVCCTEDTGYTNTQQPTPTTRPVTPSVPSTPGDGKGLQLPSPPCQIPYSLALNVVV